MAGFAFVTLVIFNKQLVGVAAEIDKKPVSVKNWVAFLTLSAAMVGLVFFMFSNMDIGQNIVYAIGAAAILYFISLMVKSGKSDALKMGTILIMTVLTTCLFTMVK
jgi:FtsH-binding integral membrane protein